MSEPVIVNDTIADRLEKVFLQALSMLDGQAKERQLLMTEKKELNNLTQLLISQTQAIGQYETGIRKRIQDCIKESANTAIQSIEKDVAEKCSQLIDQLQLINEAVTKITEAHGKMELAITKLHSSGSPMGTQKNSSSWKIFSVAIGVSILSSLLTAFLITPG